MDTVIALFGAVISFILFLSGVLNAAKFNSKKKVPATISSELSPETERRIHLAWAGINLLIFLGCILYIFSHGTLYLVLALLGILGNFALIGWVAWKLPKHPRSN